MLRIVALSDTHMMHHQMSEIPDGDVLVFAGDFGVTGSLEEFEDFLEWFSSFPHREKIIVGGNKDLCLQDDPKTVKSMLPESVHYLEDSFVGINGIAFYGAPWQIEHKEGAFQFSHQKGLLKKWQKLPENIDVLITHAPPLGFGDHTKTQWYHGDHDLAAAVFRVKPILHLFGHIHQTGGAWKHKGIRFSNVTTGKGRRDASVFDIDLDKRKSKKVYVPPRKRRKKKL